MSRRKTIRNENRPGYKKTKVGWIPEEWECVRLDAVALIKTVPFGAQLHESDYVEEGTPIITVEHLGELGIVHNNLPLVSDRDKERLSQYLLEEGDIVFSRVGSVDRNSLVSKYEKGWLFSGRLLRVRSNKQKLFPSFLSNYLHREPTKHFIKSIAVGGTMSCLNTQLLSGVPIPLPPLPEQKKIAEILSAWDRAIEQVGRLIDAKQRLKKGLMQQLLTGRMRFPEFGKPVRGKGELPEGWREVQLKDVAAILFSGVDKKSRPVQKKVRLCNYMDVYNNNYITADMDFMWATASDAEIEKYSLDVGDIMITKDSETPDDIGVPSVVTEKLDNVVCGYHLALIKPNLEKIDPIFLTKQIGYERVANQFSRLANGATRFGLTTSSVKGVRLWLPKLEEQTRIAAVLSACDREIELLKKKQEKLREQKKGLMQKLLTGEVRHPDFYLKEGIHEI